MMPQRDDRKQERGQVLVIVALGMVVLIAMVGLVLDVGATFGQRRSEQRAADLAALAGANDLLLHGAPAGAQVVADNVAKDNGYDPAVVSVVVTVSKYQSAGGTVKVDITANHRNSFSSILGFTSWDVSASATAVTGFVTGATGAGPIIFSVNDFLPNGQPQPQYTASGCPAAPVSPPQNGCPFGTVNGDAPSVGGNDLAWSNYGTANVDTSQVANIISGSEVIDRTLNLNDYIGQFNNGFHNALFQDVQQYLAGKDILVPVTTEQSPGIPDGPGSCGGPGGTPAGGGCFQGWAVFHVVAAVGGSDKSIYGYFVSGTFAPGATVEDCGLTCTTRSFGNNYGLYLTE